MGLRATVVQTLDQSEVIVPNSDLISSPVTNWTFSDRYSRLVIPVGVAYGSDVPLTMSILQAVAADNQFVVRVPEPQVFFMEFGDNSLNFELRVWIPDIEKRFQVRSEIHQEIDRRFREAKIEIAFPQRDLHLRTVDRRAADAIAGAAQGSLQDERRPEVKQVPGDDPSTARGPVEVGACPGETCSEPRCRPGCANGGRNS
jgi:potassium efflux system protein